MDQDRFSKLSRAVGQATSRRAALAAVAAAALGAVLPGLAKAESDAGSESVLITGCRIVGQRCRKKGNCCTGKCKGGRCACVNKGGSCLIDVKGLLVPYKGNCCTNRCSKATNKCR